MLPSSDAANEFFVREITGCTIIYLDAEPESQPN
jgi:hypothetical protein